MTFRAWHERSCRLANALLGLGLAKGDRVCVLAYNCLEWLEIYAATAMAGLIAVPINFRLVGPEIRYIVENCEARALIVQDELLDVSRGACAPICRCRRDNFILFGTAHRTRRVPRLRRSDRARERHASRPFAVEPHDPWTLMYTSGTTGKPKGAIRSHRGSALLSLVTEVEMGLGRATARCSSCRCATPTRSSSSARSPIAAPRCAVYNRKSFDPEHLLRTLAEGGATFTSLVPTHYIMMLGLPAAVRERYDVDAVTQADDLVGARPPRHQARDHGVFPQLRPVRALRLDRSGLGDDAAAGRAVLEARLGRTRMRRLAADPAARCDGNEVPDGEAGELYSCNAYTFDGYWKLPEKTAEAFRGDYCTVGDLARRDEDGFIYLVDRKSNMIISGGENVYPSEVEGVLGGHPEGEGRRGDRRRRREMGRARARRDRPARRRGSRRGGNPRLVQGPDRRLQAAAVDLVHSRRGDAAHRDRKDSAPRAARAA